eukprot:403338528
MLKRLNERFATKSMHDDENLQDYGYRPTAEEIHNPKLKWDDISKIKEKFRFEGDYQCSLCPKKVLQTKQDLKEHLGSKFHAENVKRYFKKNKKELQQKICEIHRLKNKGIKKYSPRFQRLAWLSIYFKVKNSLMK